MHPIMRAGCESGKQRGRHSTGEVGGCEGSPADQTSNPHISWQAVS